MRAEQHLVELSVTDSVIQCSLGLVILCLVILLNLKVNLCERKSPHKECYPYHKESPRHHLVILHRLGVVPLPKRVTTWCNLGVVPLPQRVTTTPVSQLLYARINKTVRPPTWSQDVTRPGQCCINSDFHITKHLRTR